MSGVKGSGGLEMAELIKCHMCILDNNNCNGKCIDLDDVSVLYKEGYTEKDVIPKGYCTNHTCQYNPTGFQCTLEKCALFPK